MIVFSGSSNKPLTRKIARKLGCKLGKVDCSRFANSEVRVRVLEKMSNGVAVVVQSLSSPTDENLVEFVLICDALKRMGTSKIIGVVPWLGYSKQDKVFRSGEPLSVKVIAKMLQVVPLDLVVTLDLHNPSILGFFDVPVVNLGARELFVEYFRKWMKIPNQSRSSRQSGGQAQVARSVRDDPVQSTRISADGLSSRFGNRVSLRGKHAGLKSVPAESSKMSKVHVRGRAGTGQFIVVAPDAGAVKNSTAFSRELGVPVAYMDKERDLSSGKVKIHGINREVSGRTALMIDDMIVTGSTLIETSKYLKKKGAREIVVAATHHLYLPGVDKKLAKSKLDKLVVTDSILKPESISSRNVIVLSCAGIIAECLGEHA